MSEPLQFVRDLRLPRGFSVCELGDQYVTAAESRYPASEWYALLGCGHYDCVDGNGRGTITHDLNKRFPVTRQYDLVTDFGTGEHVFNQFEVWRTIHALTRTGGSIVFDRPSSGYPGHCFYLIQKNLVTAVAHANDYEVVRLETATTTRGELLRGVLTKRFGKKFRVPQQGRYYKDLVIDDHFRSRAPEHKSPELRAGGFVGR